MRSGGAPKARGYYLVSDLMLTLQLCHGPIANVLPPSPLVQSAAERTGVTAPQEIEVHAHVRLLPLFLLPLHLPRIPHPPRLLLPPPPTARGKS